MEELVKRYYLENDFNCAEAMMHAANEAYQLNLSEETFHAFSGFGGGCGCGNLCGAVAAGVAVIGAVKTKTVAHETPGLSAATTAFIRKFKTAMGSEQCKMLKAKYTGEDRCLRVVTAAASALREVLEQG